MNMTTTISPIRDAALFHVHEVAKRMWGWAGTDLTALDASLAVAMTVQTAEIPVWLINLAPASHGKTEMLSCIEQAMGTKAFAFDKLTPASLVSGIVDKDGVSNDLLPLLNASLVVLKDMSPILEMNAAERNMIIGDLRSIYDGQFTKAFAKRGIVRYETRFNLLAAATPAWENYYAVQGVLGQRFLQVRIPSVSVKMPDEMKVSRESLRKDMTTAIKAYLDHATPRTLADKERKEIFQIAVRLSMLRGVVPRDGTKAIIGEPQIEGPYRLYRQLSVIASGSSVDVSRNVAEHGIPAVRARTIEAIKAGETTIDGIAAYTKMARTPTERYVEDLVTLGIISESGSQRPYRYHLTHVINGESKTDSPSP